MGLEQEVDLEEVEVDLEQGVVLEQVVVVRVISVEKRRGRRLSLQT